MTSPSSPPNGFLTSASQEALGSTQAERDPKGLFELCSEQRALESVLEAAGGEITPGSDLERLWEENCALLIRKVDRYALFLGSLESEAERFEALAKAATSKARALKNARQRMLDRALVSMDDKDELVGEHLRLVRRKNPPAVQVLNEDHLRESLPEAFEEVTTYKLNKSVVKAAIERNPAAVQGAILTRGERCEVKL